MELFFSSLGTVGMRQRQNAEGCMTQRDGNEEGGGLCAYDSVKQDMDWGQDEKDGYEDDDDEYDWT